MALEILSFHGTDATMYPLKSSFYFTIDNDRNFYDRGKVFKNCVRENKSLVSIEVEALLELTFLAVFTIGI